MGRLNPRSAGDGSLTVPSRAVGQFGQWTDLSPFSRAEVPVATTDDPTAGRHRPVPPDGLDNAQGGGDDGDTRRLHELGYAQELRRSMSAFSNFAVSFTIISILSGCLTLYLFGMNTGGPAVITWGWLIVGAFTLFVGLAMAEVCSSFPTAGGLYYWSAKLARRNGRGLVLVHRLVQLPRPGRGHRRHRLRRRLLPQLLPQPAVRLRPATPGTRSSSSADPAPARPAQHVRRPARRRCSTTSACGGTWSASRSSSAC